MTPEHRDLEHLDGFILRLVRAHRRSPYHLRMMEGVNNVPSVGALRVLRTLERRQQHGESTSIRDVADDLEIEQSTASRAVNIVVERGLVARSGSSEDLRRVQLVLTARGRAAMKRTTANRLSLLREATTGWTGADVRELAVLLGRLLDVYEELDPPTGRRANP